MNCRIFYVLLISLFLAPVTLFGAGPNLYMQSIFYNESITSTSSYGSRITLGFGKERKQVIATFRLQYPETCIALHATTSLHGEESPVQGRLVRNYGFVSHDRDMKELSLITAYGLQMKTPVKKYPSFFCAHMGLHGSLILPSSYVDTIRWSINAHLSASIAQAFGKHLLATLFLTSDTLCLQQNNLAFMYGGSLAYSIDDTVVLGIRALLQLSDFTNESLFVTMHEITCSLGISDKGSSSLRTEMGIWL